MRLRDQIANEPDRDPVAVVQAALDAGIRMVATADAYQNEELVGRTIRGRREEVLLASKVGLVWRDEVASGFDVRADRSYVLHACETSLRRLGVDVIDLYYLHHRSERIPIEETIEAMAELVAQGKVRALGLSNVTADDLRRAQAPPTTPRQDRSHWPGCTTESRSMACRWSRFLGRPASAIYARTWTRPTCACLTTSWGAWIPSARQRDPEPVV